MQLLVVNNNDFFGFYDKMVADKLSRTKWYGQNGTDRIMN